ncbi:MAG: DNA primase [Phycisphaerae bacterium]
MIGRDSELRTEQVRQASDIVDVVSQYVTLKRAGREFRALCPFHNEKTPSFYVVPEKQIFKCFGCSAGGDVFKFIQMKEGVGFREAMEMLATRAGITLAPARAASASADGPSKTDLERVNRWACRWFHQRLRQPDAAPVRAYAAKRGMTDASIETFSIGFAPESWNAMQLAARSANIPTKLLLAAGLVKSGSDGSSYDAFRNRLIFPIRDAMDRVIGFGGRALGDDPAKYLNSPQSLLFEKNRCLYGLPTAKRAFASAGCAVVVEGYIDCILAQQAGFEHTVATLGTALTTHHARLLRRYVDAAVLIFDSDEAGRRAADRAIGAFLAERLDLRVAQVPEGQDPADLLVSQGPEAFQAVLSSARSALECKWDQVQRRYRDAASGPDRRRAIEEFLALVAGSGEWGTCDPIQRGLLLNQVGKLLGLSGEEVYRQLRIVARRSASARPEAASSSPAGPRPRMPNAATAAIRDLVEVLLNDAGYYPAVASDFDPDWSADAELRAIAKAVAEMAREEGEISLPRLISRFESAGTARRITDLQLAGERRGNLAATVDGALACLQALKEERQVAELMAGLKRQNNPSLGEDGAPSGDARADEARNAVRAIGEAARKSTRFAARKHLAAFETTGADSRDPRTAD